MDEVIAGRSTTTRRWPETAVVVVCGTALLLLSVPFVELWLLVAPIIAGAALGAFAFGSFAQRVRHPAGRAAIAVAFVALGSVLVFATVLLVVWVGFGRASTLADVSEWTRWLAEPMFSVPVCAAALVTALASARSREMRAGRLAALAAEASVVATVLALLGALSASNIWS